MSCCFFILVVPSWDSMLIDLMVVISLLWWSIKIFLISLSHSIAKKKFDFHKLLMKQQPFLSTSCAIWVRLRLSFNIQAHFVCFIYIYTTCTVYTNMRTNGAQVNLSDNKLKWKWPAYRFILYLTIIGISMINMDGTLSTHRHLCAYQFIWSCFVNFERQTV